MSVFLRVDINIVAMLFLGLIRLIANGRLDREDPLNRAFLRVSLIVMIQLLFETGTCIMNQWTGQWPGSVSVFMHLCLFAVAPFLAYHWYILARNIFVSCDSGFMTRDKLLLPALLNAVITLLSPAYELVFYIDSFNVYHRGKLFFVASAITYFYFFYGLMLIIKGKRRMVKQEFALLFLSGVLPILGGIVQSLFYGTLFMWSSAAFSLLILYIYLLQRMVQLDDLTGAWCRSSFQEYMSKIVRQDECTKIGIIYIDIDGLKQINDRYGHLEGDHAIKTLIQLIRSVIRKDDVVVRMGGDEFVIVLDCATDEVLKTTVNRIETSLGDYNRTAEKGYRLECSFGADIFQSDCDGMEQFLHHIDTLMYQNKKMKKADR